MTHMIFPVIDLPATGANILRLRKACGLTVHDLQLFFGFDQPQAIYKWQRGQSLPSVDNLYALSVLFGIPMNEILVSGRPQVNKMIPEQQAEVPAAPVFAVMSFINNSIMAQFRCHSTRS